MRGALSHFRIANEFLQSHVNCNLFGKSKEITRKFKIPENKSRFLIQQAQRTDLGKLETPFYHLTVTYMH